MWCIEKFFLDKQNFFSGTTFFAQFYDRELTKCAVLGIDMLLLLLGGQAKMEFYALHSTQQIYIVFELA